MPLVRKLTAEYIGTFWLVLGGRHPAGDLAANGYGDHSPGNYSMAAGFVCEVVMTCIFLFVIMGATDKRAPVGFAPLAIGLALTLIHVSSPRDGLAARGIRAVRGLNRGSSPRVCVSAGSTRGTQPAWLPDALAAPVTRRRNSGIYRRAPCPRTRRKRCTRRNRYARRWSPAASLYRSTHERGVVAAWVSPVKSMIRAWTSLPETVSSPTEIGSLNRLGPQLPGLI